jgi:nitrate reductase NapE component
MEKQTENEITQENTTAETVESTAPAATAEKQSFLKRAPKWALITLPLLSVAAIAAVGGYGYARTHASNNDQIAAYSQMQSQGNAADANGPAGYAPVGYAPGYYYGPQNYQNGYGYGQGYGRGYGQGYGQSQGHANMNANFGFGGHMNGSGNSAANGGNGWNNNGWM